MQAVGFCSICPKTYAIQLSNGQSIIKMKGFQIKGANDCNYANFKLMVTTDHTMSFNVPFNLRRDIGLGQLRKVAMVKHLTKEFDKRIVLEDYRTVPYGYKSSDRMDHNRRGLPVYQLDVPELENDEDDVNVCSDNDGDD